MSKPVPYYVSTSNGPDEPTIIDYPSKAAAQRAADRSNEESEAMRYGGHATVHRGLVLASREDKATVRAKRRRDDAKGKRNGLTMARGIVEAVCKAFAVPHPERTSLDQATVAIVCESIAEHVGHRIDEELRQNAAK